MLSGFSPGSNFAKLRDSEEKEFSISLKDELFCLTL